MEQETSLNIANSIGTQVGNYWRLEKVNWGESEVLIMGIQTQNYRSPGYLLACLFFNQLEEI